MALLDLVGIYLLFMIIHMPKKASSVNLELLKTIAHLGYSLSKLGNLSWYFLPGRQERLSVLICKINGVHDTLDARQMAFFKR